MPNTGVKIVLSLKEINDNTGVPTGNTKPNTPGDPDYIAPSVDFDTCPVEHDLVCPVILLTGSSGILVYEFNVLNSVLSNPIVSDIRISAMLEGVSQGDVNIGLPNATGNYFGGSFTSLTAGTYSIRVQYIDEDDNVVQTCSSGSAVVS